MKTSIFGFILVTLLIIAGFFVFCYLVFMTWYLIEKKKSDRAVNEPIESESTDETEKR